MNHIALWNGFQEDLQILVGDESFAATMAQVYLDGGEDVIYFFAHVDSFELSPME